MVKRKATQDRRKFKVRPRNVTSRTKRAREEDARLAEILGKERNDVQGL